MKLTSESPSGCKQGQAWAAREAAEVPRSWGKGPLMLVLLSYHGSFASGTAGITEITRFQGTIGDDELLTTAISYISQSYPISFCFLIIYLSLLLSLSLYTVDFVGHCTIQKICFLERDFSISIFDQKAHEAEGELSCSKAEQIRKPDPCISHSCLSHLTPTFGTLCFALCVEQSYNTPKVF